MQNSDSLTAGGSAKIGVKLTREAMEARDLVKTLQKLHRNDNDAFQKTESLLETGLNFQFPWASLLAIIVGFDGRYTSRFQKK